MGFPWSETINVVIATFSAAAAGGSWKAARRANDAARRSNATAEAVARIERERWHADLTPQFEITTERQPGNEPLLSVRLEGPLALGHLDEVAVSIRNDKVRIATPPGPPSQQQVDAHVWGPYRFTAGSDGADADGRTVQPVRMRVGEGCTFSIDPTRYPNWTRGDDAEARWRGTYAGAPIRLTLTCTKAGQDVPWVVPYLVENPARPRFRTL